jgi:hypothetical protein
VGFQKRHCIVLLEKLRETLKPFIAVLWVSIFGEETVGYLESHSLDLPRNMLVSAFNLIHIFHRCLKLLGKVLVHESLEK